MPADNSDIADDCGLLRRVTPNQIVPDDNVGGRRLSSGAFRDRALSVDAECLLNADGLDWQFSLRDHPDFFLVRIKAGLARQHQQTVQHRKVPDNDYHAEVSGRKSDPICNELRKAAEWVKKPNGVA
jgi:hypothetical protein